MKSWNEAELVALDLVNTQYGGDPSDDFDNTYFDQNGALHVNFTPVKNS